MPFLSSMRGSYGGHRRFGGGGRWPANSTSGYAQFSNTSTSWAAPAGVWRVNVVAVGGGGGGSYQWSGGGAAGGGLAWADSIRVTPGVTYTVVGGTAGPRIANTSQNGARGGDSYFISRSVICGFGGGSTYYYANAQTSYNGYGQWINGSFSGNANGQASLFNNGANDAVGGGWWVNPVYMCNSSTGEFSPATGASLPTCGGGSGGWGAYTGNWTTSGAGAGGYAGMGGTRSGPEGDRNGSGGAGGRSGTHYSSTYGGVGGGGGVGISGRGPGASGSGDGGTYNYSAWTGWSSIDSNPGGGESGSYAPESYGYVGENPWTGTPWPGGQNNIKGADYGGGGGGSGTSSGGGAGGQGAIRIIWNTNGQSARTYPNA